MRKRLIEKFTKSKEGSLGYTLTELLVVIGIIALVCAIAIPSVIAISKALRFKQRNDYAKSIFMAAQQNLTEMRSDGGLKPLQSANGASMIPATATSFPDEYRSEYVYTTTGTDAFNLILPAGSIDSSVRDDAIIIEYNPITGNVYAVFYSVDEIASAYASSNLPRADTAARKEMMLGYYDGSGLNSSQIELEKSQAQVEFINGEEGIVRVLVPVPDDFFGSVDKFAQALTINLTVTGEYSMVQAAETAADEGESGTQTQTPVTSFSIQIKDSSTGLSGSCYTEYGNTIVVEYPIDSLVNMGSFANYASGTQAGAKDPTTNANLEGSLTKLMDETVFTVLPGENVTIQADVAVDTAVSGLQVKVDSGILSGVNPMFAYLQPSGSGKYVLAVSNGRNLQNLNAMAPTMAKQVESVVFTSDIYWNDTVSYYNSKYGTGEIKSYASNADEAPARALPYFVPIHHEDLFGTARFIFPNEGDGGLGGILGSILNAIFGGYTDSDVPTLTDEMDTVTGVTHASIQGNGHKVFNLNIDSTKYEIPNVGKKGSVKNPQTGEIVETDLTGTFYATGDNQIIDYCFTGLFGYVNTPIDDLHVVNPIVKGHEMTKETTVVQNYIYIFGIPFPIGTTRVNLYNNPATGALIGAGGFNTLVTDCSTYIDKDARGYMDLTWGPKQYAVNGTQNWYGVSGEGAVGGLVGYAKSHRTVSGELTNDKATLAFSGSFAAVPVSGNMRGINDKDFGYSNGVGAFIGNSQLTNFYNCYASGDVLANGCRVSETLGGGLLNSITEIFGIKLDLLYNGRTSMGAGGFVGTSHGTRYTNCFATGNVTASSRSDLGAGGFVGFMSIDETFTYGNLNKEGKEKVAQRTVFTECYSVGMAVTNDKTYENFSGGNGRIAFSLNQSMTYVVGDYYRLYAPYYKEHKTAPSFESVYIYRDSYFLSNYHTDEDSQENSSNCAEPEPYSTFEDLVGNHGANTAWTDTQLNDVKTISLYRSGNWPNYKFHTYETEYFNKVDGLEEIYRGLYDAGYAPAEWIKATASTTHPYSLPNGSVYPFTKLVGMDYYGDWPSKPSDIGLAYYETYEDTKATHYFFDKNHSDYTSLSLRSGDGVMVTADGYAIFSADDENLVVTVGDETATLVASGETYTVSNKSYHVFRLTDKLMAAMPANGEFYVKVTASHADSDDEYTMYFNPNVAISHVNPTDGKHSATKPDAAPKTIYVRSARQLKAIALMEDFWGEEHKYIQQLNIDAAKYTGWGWDADDRKIGSIGNLTHVFNASYSAGYTAAGDVASQYKIAGFQPVEAGFFGVIGDKGSVENLTIECGTVTAGSADTADVAVLAGWNQGSITNVDMSITGAVTLTAKTNAGLVAGYSSGSIADCEVTAAAVTMNAPNAGGFIGNAVGKEGAKTSVTNATLKLTGALSANGATNVGGFVGCAEHFSMSMNGENAVSLNGMSVTAAEGATALTYAGGMAGYAKNADIAMKGTDEDEKYAITLNGTLNNVGGYMAGLIGGGENVTVNSVDVKAAALKGKAAAGFLGNGTNVDASYCDVVITGGITGESMSAGVADVLGAQSVFEYVPVTLTNTAVTATAGDAAGYAVEIAKEANVMSSSVTLGGTAKITGSANAAGYAAKIAGYVGNNTGSAMLSSVVGKGEIKGGNASGFAGEITGQVAGGFVTPAVNTDDYLENANANLKVTGTTNAAGFALSVGDGATVTNSYALNAISGTNAYGFIGSNKGTVSGCMANVDISGGYAFIGTNEGTVTRCYGWYGDGNEKDATTTVATVNGKCYSAYFADLNPVDKEGEIVTLYDAKGAVQSMTATELQGAADILAGDNYKWYTTGYSSYPYTEKPAAMPNYLYPMLRDHYGDWITPPQYAYGVAYYETCEIAEAAASDGEAAPAAAKTVTKIHMIDLSDASITEEKIAISTYLIDNAGTITLSNKSVFDNEGTIKSFGYAVFGKSGSNILNGISNGEKPLFSYTLNNNQPGKNIAYDFYAMKTDAAKDGIVSIGATAVSNATANVDIRFADAINPDGTTYVVRTPEQLANVAAKSSATISQTHDITLTGDFATIADRFTGTYNGNGCTLDASNATNGWMNGTTTVTGLNLKVGNVNASIFGDITGEVNLTSLSVGSIGESGSIANATEKFEVTEAVSVGAVNGKLFGSVKNVNLENGLTVASVADGKIAVESVNGTFQSGGIAVTGNIGTGAALFGEVQGTLNGGAETTAMNITVGGNVNGSLINTVNGETTKVKLGDFSGEGKSISGSLIGAVKGGTVNVGAVTVGNVTGKLFGEVAGTLTVGTVSTQAVGSAGAEGSSNNNAKLFGAISGGTVTVDKVTTNGNAVYGNVFESVGGSLTVTNGITAGAVNGSVVGGVGASDATGTVNTGKITVNGAAAQVVGDVNGSVTVAGIEVTGAATNVFGNVVSGTGVTVNGGIQTNGVNGQVFGSVDTAVTVTGTIQTGAVTGSVFGNIGATNTSTAFTVSTGAITSGAVTDNVFGTIGGKATVETGAITVESLGGQLAGAVSGTLKGKAANTAVNIGAEGAADLSKNLVGAVSGSLMNFAVKANNVTASVIPSLTGTVDGVSLTAGTATVGAPVLVADNDGMISNCSVKVGTATVTGAGVLANEVVSGKSITSSTVAVDTLTVTNAGGNAGVLVGKNNGTISGATVKAKTDSATMTATIGGATVGGLVGENAGALANNTVTIGAMNVSGASMVGGLTGKNTSSVGIVGEATSDTTNVTVTINYTPGEGGTTIGGLVGENSGTIKGVEVGGAINLASGTGSGKSYVVGGAVGKITAGTVTGTTSSATVAPEWAKAVKVVSDETFGNSGITNNGPVGMFVGYAGAVTLDGCSSTAANSTYQFIGEATVGTQTIGDYWVAAKGYDTLTAYDEEEPYGEDASYAAVEDSAVTLSKASGDINKINTTLTNCTFKLGDTVRTQTLGGDGYYYTQGEPKWQSAYVIGIPKKIEFDSANDLVYTVTYSGNGNPEYKNTGLYYKISETEFGRADVSIVKEKTGEVAGFDRFTYTITLRYYLDSNMETYKDIIYKSEQLKYITPRSDEVTVGDGKLYKMKDISIDNGAYLIVSGNNAIGESEAKESIADVKSFDKRDTLSNFVYTYSGSAISNGAVTHAETSNNLNLPYYNNVEKVNDSMVAPVVFAFTDMKLGEETKFQLYPLTVNSEAYKLLTFKWNKTAYQDQYLTYSPMDTGSKASIEEIPTETTTPTSETTGGETQNPTE